MARFLTTLPSNTGYFNLGTVEAYPTGGSGPTAYGPTSYFGSDPLPERKGDSINNPLNLGDFSSGFKAVDITNSHGGNSRIQSTFYTFILTRPRSIQILQNFSPTSYQSNTNRNTIVSVYRQEESSLRRELPINDSGYVYKEASIVEDDSYSEYDAYQTDYPSLPLDEGRYILLITNDIRYLETTYSFTIQSAITDWRFVEESVGTLFDFGAVVDSPASFVDFGLIRNTAQGPGSEFPYSSTSGLGYTRSGVSP